MTAQGHCLCWVGIQPCLHCGSWLRQESFMLGAKRLFIDVIRLFFIHTMLDDGNAG